MPRKTQKPSARSRKAAPEPEPHSSAVADFLGRAVTASGGAIARNPMAVGGSTAFFVALFFVSANAMWYQPHFHTNAFFSTRQQPQNALPFEQELKAMDAPRTSDAAAPMPSTGDPVVEQVQTVLADLKLYRGTIDGRMGRETGEAIATYQKILGQPATGKVDDALLNQLRIQTSTASIARTPVPSDPRPESRPGQDEVAALISGGGTTGSTTQQPAGAADADRVSRIQAGLRAFGNETVDIDGKMGAKTRTAIREFQSLFGLQQSGEPDDVLYAKMRAIGLTE